jgi:hypothetical protein
VLSPGDQADVRSAASGALDKEIIANMDKIKTNDARLANFVTALDKAESLGEGIKEMIVPSKEVIEGYKNAIVGGADLSQLLGKANQATRDAIMKTMTPEDWAKVSTVDTSAATSVEEYNFYAQQERAAGREPMSYNDYQTLEANRKAKASGTSGLTSGQNLSATMQLAGKVDTLNKANNLIVNQYSLMKSAYDRYTKGEAKDLNGTSQAIIMIFNKILDPNSVVRESEYARTPEGVGLLQMIEGKATKLTQGGAGLTPNSLKEFVDLAATFSANALKSIESEKQRAGALSDKYGLDTAYITGGYVPNQNTNTQGQNNDDPMGIR